MCCHEFFVFRKRAPFNLQNNFNSYEGIQLSDNKNKSPYEFICYFFTKKSFERHIQNSNKNSSKS